MNEENWISDLYQMDGLESFDVKREEVIYTLFISDFLHMPDLDYGELIKVDPHLRALLN